MTEAEWLACVNPRPMLENLQGKASDRKLRLLGCGFCRAVWGRLTHPATRRSVEVAELFADGKARTGDLQRAFQEADGAAQDPERPEPAGFFQLGIPAGAAFVARPQLDPELLWNIAELLRDDSDENGYAIHFDFEADQVRYEEVRKKAWHELGEETRQLGLR
jgi:hypothetical protein